MLNRTQEEESAVLSSIVPAAPPTAASQQDTVSTAPGGEETKRWIACIEAGIARSKRRSRIVWWGNGIHYAAVFIFLGIFVAVLDSHKSHHVFPDVFWMIFYINFLVPFVNGVLRTRWSLARRAEEHAAAQQLAATDDPALIGPLIDALFYCREDATTRGQLCRALTRLLPHLTEEQARDLGKERHGILASWIRDWEYSGMKSQGALLIEFLHVLAAVGRERIETVTLSGTRGMVSLLRILKPWTLGTKAGQDPGVRQAAVACREAILHQKVKTGTEEQLLRASAPPASAPEHLLHPVQGAPPIAPDELLRPGSPERVPSADGKGS